MRRLDAPSVPPTTGPAPAPGAAGAAASAAPSATPTSAGPAAAPASRPAPADQPAAPLRLENTTQPYDWGSPTAIPELLGTAPDGRPVAELWLGAHPSAPSRASRTDVPGEAVPLPDLVRRHPGAVLGPRVLDAFGPRLPYLLKVLAADRALSLQVHPKPHTARAGYNRENRHGVPLDAAERSFRDDQHKPELVVALTPFEGLAGLRPVRAVLAALEGLDGALVAELATVLRDDRSSAGVRRAVERALAARDDAGVADDLAVTVASVRRRLAAGSPVERADRTVLALADQHPGDPGAVVSLLLNRVTLEPGEALYIPAGEIHAYLSGVAVEIMASSDNVLRAGLTTKRVDTRALLECASFAPHPPTRPSVTVAGRHAQVRTYRAPVEEFALTVAELEPGEAVDLPASGPRIVLCTEGAAELRTSRGDVHLGRGASALVPHAAGRLRADGDGQVFCAWVP